MTKGEMKAEVARRLAEASGRVFWSDTDISEAIDLAYEEISDEVEWYEAHVDVSLLNDRPFYDLRAIVGDNFLAVRPAFAYDTNRWLIPTGIRNLDQHDRRWERVTGDPQRFFMRGLWWLCLYPKIQSDTGSFKLYHTALPPPMVDEDDEPGFPSTFHDGIIDYALADLFAQDGETSLALAAWAHYLETEGKFSAWVNERNSGPLVRGWGDGSELPR